MKDTLSCMMKYADRGVETMQDIFSEFFEGYTEVCDMDGGYAFPQRFSGKLKKFFEEIKFRRCNCSAGIVIRANKCKKFCFDYKTFDGLGFAEFDVLNKSTHKTEHYHLSETEGTFEIIANEDNIEIYLGYQNMFAFKNFIIDSCGQKGIQNFASFQGGDRKQIKNCQTAV